MSIVPQQIDHGALAAVLAAHITAYGRSIRYTDPELTRRIEGANVVVSEMAKVIIDCYAGFELFRDAPEASDIAWHMFTHGFDLALELVGFVSESPLSPNADEMAHVFDSARALINRTIESAIAERKRNAQLAADNSSSTDGRSRG